MPDQPSDPGVTLHHVALYVSDLELTRRFYRSALGMEEIARPAEFTFPGAYFRLARVGLRVDAAPAAVLPPQDGGDQFGPVRKTVRVSDKPQSGDRLRECGASPAESDKLPTGVSHILYPLIRTGVVPVQKCHRYQAGPAVKVDGVLR